MNDLMVTLKASVGVKGTKNLDLGSVVDSSTIAHSSALTFGTGAGNANQEWTDKRTLAATSENLDLSGVLINGFGETIAFTKIVGIMIKNLSTTPGNDLIVGGASANAFVNWVADATDKIKVRAGGAIFLVAPNDGYAVTAGTADILKIDAASATIDYEIAIIGIA